MELASAPAQTLGQPPAWRKHTLLITLSGLTLISLSITAFLLIRSSNSSPLASIATQKSLVSGTFDINGIIPAGASIVIKRVNASSTTDNATYPQNFPAVDQGTWSLDNTSSGKSYVITAAMVVNGNVVASSDPVEVTAPAANEPLTINIPDAHPTGAAVISGDIKTDGYIPPGSTITVKGRILGKQTYSTIASGLPGTQSQFMSYATATAGQSYEIEGLLLDSNSNQIGISQPLTVTAPAMNESLTINSTATPPATPIPTPTKIQQTTSAPTSQQSTPTPVPTQTTISGSINFNGVAPVNSRIVILARVYSTQQYQVVVNNITPVDGTTWQWTGAKEATWYDVVAVLKQTQSDGTDQDIALSQTLSVAAPATNVALTINSGIVLSPPTGTITASCGNLSGSTWGGQMIYPSVQNAQTYWLEVGSTNGGNDVYNSIQNTNNQPNQTASVNFNNGITYYARYAYAMNLNAAQPQFSPFSSTMQFKCGQ